MTESTLTDDATQDPQTAATADAVAASDRVLDRILDLDEFMTQAKAPVWSARVCLRADLEGRREVLIEELAELVDSEGRPLAEGDENAIADVSRVTEINEELQSVQRVMRDGMRVISGVGFLEEAFTGFQRQHVNADGTYKDRDDYFNRLVAETATAPEMTLEQVRVLRTKLTWAQWNKIATAALSACTSSGVDVPLLPAFSRGPRPQGS